MSFYLLFSFSFFYSSVDHYHSSLPRVQLELQHEFTSQSVQDYFHKLAQLDVERIETTLSLENLPIVLYEILSHRRLWSDVRLVQILSQWFSNHSSKERIDWNVLRMCPGMYQWLVSPDSGIRYVSISFGFQNVNLILLLVHGLVVIWVPLI